MFRSLSRPLALLLCFQLHLTLRTASLAAEVSALPPIGSEIPDLKFKDIRYLPRSLKDFGEKKAFVLVFTNTTCPLAQKYWPKLKRLEEQYREEGVQFVSVNVGGDDEIQRDRPAGDRFRRRISVREGHRWLVREAPGVSGRRKSSCSTRSRAALSRPDRRPVPPRRRRGRM